MDHAYWGKAYDRGEVKTGRSTSAGVSYEYVGDDDKLAELCASELRLGRVLGWYQGRFEWGPRALGNRSIIADPRREEMKDVVNTKIKFREPFRPFAPSILAEGNGALFRGARGTILPPGPIHAGRAAGGSTQQESIPAVVSHGHRSAADGLRGHEPALPRAH